jgi:Alcohol dehydrogenase GroES-like domain
MLAVQLHAPGLDGLAVEETETPRARAGEALVEVHAAAITRDELEWPVDRLPAIPSYELSGVVVDVADDVQAVAVGDAVYALTAFDRDGVAAAYAAVPASLLAPKPSTLDHVESATIPLPALSAWQGLFDHGRLEPGHRVLVTDTMGRLAPKGLIGIHTNLLVPALNGPMPTDTDEERAAAAQIATFRQSGNGKATGTPHFSPHGLRRRRGSLHYKHTGSLAEVAELLGDSKRVAADHYVYALTDYREVDRSVPLARARAYASG